jgi:hypothetical protein
MSASTSSRYRFVVAGVLLTGFALLWVMRELKMFAAYELFFHFFGVDPITEMPFVDFHAILSSAECFRRGVDVYVTNPCDIFGRVYAYSPLLLAWAPSWLGTADTWWTGAAVAIIFLLSLAWLQAFVIRPLHIGRNVSAPGISALVLSNTD